MSERAIKSCGRARAGRRFLPTALAATLALAAATTTACSDRERTSSVLDPPTAPFARPRRVVVVTIDTLRADHLGFYGYRRETAPFLAELATRSAVFDRMIAASSHTNPAHASLFTGLHLPQHKLLWNGQKRLDASIRTLAQLFQDAGYETAGFFSVPWLDVLGRGFDVFSTRARAHGYATAEATVSEALTWLGQRDRADDIFLWIHVFDPHNAFDAPPELVARMQPTGERAVQEWFEYWTRAQHKDASTVPAGAGRDAFVRWQAGYDAKIAYVDAQLRRLYEGARDLGLLAESLWVITSDHGEGLGSHGYGSHGRVIYQEQVLAPFLVHHPDGGIVTGRVEGVAEHTALYPTLAEAIGIRPPQQVLPMRSASLLALLRAETTSIANGTAYSQRRKKYEAHTDGWAPGPVYSLQDERYKYVVHSHGDDEFFDLARDPYELENLAGRETPLELEWRARTRAAHETMRSGALALEESQRDDRHLDALRALGYTE